MATSDESALDLLARLYQGGESTPRLIWPEGETIRVRGEISPARCASRSMIAKIGLESAASSNWMAKKSSWPIC